MHVFDLDYLLNLEFIENDEFDPECENEIACGYERYPFVSTDGIIYVSRDMVKLKDVDVSEILKEEQGVK